MTVENIKGINWPVPVPDPLKKKKEKHEKKKKSQASISSFDITAEINVKY